MKTADEWMFEKGKTVEAGMKISGVEYPGQEVSILTKEDIVQIQADALNFAQERSQSLLAANDELKKRVKELEAKGYEICGETHKRITFLQKENAELRKDKDLLRQSRYFLKRCMCAGSKGYRDILSLIKDIDAAIDSAAKEDK